jgi:septal ring factor EnvC (AmiA/AmiB activator)
MGPAQSNKHAVPQPPTLDELRKLHQKYEKHEEQLERTQRKVDKCEAQRAQLQEELDQHKAHLEGRRAARDEAKRAFDVADLRHRVERPMGTLAEDSELYDVSQIVAATAWVAAKAKTAGQETPPREIRRAYRSLPAKGLDTIWAA